SETRLVSDIESKIRSETRLVSDMKTARVKIYCVSRSSRTGGCISKKPEARHTRKSLKVLFEASFNRIHGTDLYEGDENTLAVKYYYPTDQIRKGSYSLMTIDNSIEKIGLMAGDNLDNEQEHFNIETVIENVYYTQIH
ncbi:MAG: hypothetical protein JKX76_02325, partial [Colwellia sp.]|nr:hypothetical protein [Colwellia sp.]